MVPEKILIEQQEDVAIISIHNPPANSLGVYTIKELDFSIHKLGNENSVKVIILTGKGAIFSAGAELKELTGARTSKQAEKIVAGAKAVFGRIERLKKSVVAAINGLCLGGGLELALACHIRVADENAKFGFPEIKLALMPGAGGTQRLPRLVGLPKAFEIILTGELLDVREAHRIGLVNAITPAGESLNVAKGIAEKISQKGQVAVRSILESIRFSADFSASEGMERETRLFGKVFETEDAKEGIAAFLEKRKPNFKDK